MYKVCEYYEIMHFFCNERSTSEEKKKRGKFIRYRASTDRKFEKKEERVSERAERATAAADFFSRHYAKKIKTKAKQCESKQSVRK